MTVKATRTTCAQCGGEIPPKRLRFGAKFCRRECERIRNAEVWRAKNPSTGLSPGTAGAVSELIVATDLMLRGYSVFRALSPSCQCDLLALGPDGRSLRVEVRTGYVSAGGKPLCSLKKCDKSKHDVLAVVVNLPNRAHRLVYEPSLE